MPFASYITVTTYTMVASGFAALCMVEELGRGFLIFSGAVTAVSLAAGKRVRLPAYLWNVVALAVFLFFLLDYFALSGALLPAASRLLTTLTVLKLYDLKKTRDYLILYSLVFFELLAATASTVSPFFFVILSFFIVSAIWAMVVFNLKKDSEEYGMEKNIPRAIFGGAFFLATLALTAASLLITMAIFFIMPRMGIGFFQRKTLNTIKVSGFSDVVDLGEIGRVKLDPTVVMRVTVEGGTPPSPLYIRGAALDYYDGRRWKRTGEKKELLKKTGAGAFSSGLKKEHAAVAYRIMLEPLSTDVLFTPYPWLNISGRFNNLWRDREKTLYLASPPYSRIEYTVWAMAEGEEASADSVEERYLQLPSQTEGVDELSSMITEGIESDLDRARAIERYLRENHRYTLDPKKGKGRNPLEDFLFFTKEGYCEHYATAMVVMLRARGVPARIVTGFVEGQWNRYGGYFLIRQQDSHSWVEASIKGRGWRRFDPTPAAGLATPLESSSLGLYFDSLQWRWARYIIGYSFADQIRAATAVEAKADNMRAFIENALAGLFPGKGAGARAAILFLALAFAAIACLFLGAAFLKGRRPPLYPKTPRFYLEMLNILRKKGFEKKGFETPLEFAVRTGRPAAVKLTEVFQEERYGWKTPEEKDREEIGFLLESLRRGC